MTYPGPARGFGYSPVGRMTVLLFALLGVCSGVAIGFASAMSSPEPQKGRVAQSVGIPAVPEVRL